MSAATPPTFPEPTPSAVSIEELKETFEFFDDWEDKYRFVIDLGKALPDLAPEHRIDERVVHGCQSQVWLWTREQGHKLELAIDSDAFIVKGLIAIVLAAYQGRPVSEVASFDIEGLFAELDLLKHLSVTRGNGLRAMIKQIQQRAQELL